MVTHWIYTLTVDNRHLTLYLPVDGAGVTLGALPGQGSRAVKVRDLDLDRGRSQGHTFASVEALADRLRLVDRELGAVDVEVEGEGDDDERQTLQVRAV
jgi:hypothetical protein